MAGPNQFLNVVEAASLAVSRLLPIVEHLPDSFSKWIPPIKAAVRENQNIAAKLGLAASATKILGGRFKFVGAVVAAMNLQALGATKKVSLLGAVGGLVTAKLIRGFSDSRREAAKLAAQTSKNQAGMAALGRTAAATASKEKKVGGSAGGGGIGKIIAAVGGYRLLTAAVQRFKAAYDLGGQLSDQKSKTGISEDQLLILGQAGKDGGVEDVTGSVNKMQDALVDAVRNGAGPAAKALGLLNLRAEELVTKTPVGQIQAIGAALRGIKSPEIRTSVVRDLFGKSGTDLLPFLDDAEALETAQKSLGRQAGILKENSARFDAVSDRLARAGLKIQGFFVGLAATVLPLMEAATAKLDALDLASQGEKFGAGIRAAVDVLAGAFADPQTLLGGLEGYLKAAFLGAGNILVATIKAVVPNLGRVASGLAGIFIGLQQVISGSLMKAFAGPLEFLTAAIQAAFEKATGLFAQAQDALTPGGSDAGNSFRAGNEAVEQSIFEARKRLKKSGEMDGNNQPLSERAKKTMAMLEQVRPANPFKGRGIGEIQKANGPLVGELGDEQIANGQATLKAELGALFDAVSDSFKAIKVDDVLGAGAELAAANKAIGNLRKAGKKIVEAFVGSPAAPSAPGKADPFANFATASRGSSLRSTGLSAASMAGALVSSRLQGPGLPGARVTDLSRATRPASVLSASERRAFEDSRVAAGGTRTGTTAGAYGVVRAGDAARRKNAEKEKERERLKNENSVARSNELLGGIYDSSRRTAEALEE